MLHGATRSTARVNVMTPTAVDTTAAQLSADNDTNKDRRTRESKGPSDLFAQILQGASVQHVAYANLAQQFNLALKLRDDTMARAQEGATDRPKYEGLASPEDPQDGVPASNRAPGGAGDTFTEKPADPSNEAIPDTGDDRLPIAKAGNEVGTAPTGQKPTEGDGRLTSSRTSQAGDVAVAARTAANAEAARVTGRQGETANPAANGENNGRTQTLGGASVTSLVSRASGNGNSHGTGGTNVKVTQAPEDIVSQPTTTLAASAAVSAQTRGGSRAEIQRPVQPADDFGGEGRVSLFDDGTSRTTATKPQSAATRAGKPDPGIVGGNTAESNGGADPTAGNQPSATLVAPRTLVAAAAARTDGMVPANHGVSGDPIAGTNGSNGSGQTTQRAQNVPTPHRPRPQIPPQYVTNQVAVQIQKAVGQGMDNIRIQLSPAELGRVDVKLEIAKDGRTVAVVTADRTDTLDLLQRDARSLQQALQEAGLNVDSNSLSFNLRGDGSAFERELSERGGVTGAGSGDDAAPESDIAEVPAAPRNLVSDDRVDVEV